MSCKLELKNLLILYENKCVVKCVITAINSDENL